MSDPRGLTLLETIVLLAVVAPLAVALAIGCGGGEDEDDDGNGGYLKAVTDSQHRAREERCRSNLRALAQGLALYRTEYNDAYPCLGRSRTIDAAPRQWDSIDAFWENEGDCNLQAYWLLVDEEHVSYDHFECPSDEQYEPPEQTAGDTCGFESWHNVSFGFQPATRHADNAAFPSDNMGRGVIIVGDKPREDRLSWNANHPDRGGNYLDASGSTRWAGREDNRIGVNDNNVYLIDMNADGSVVEGTTAGLPDHVSDSFLHWVDD